jgi:DNA segregation ATPase FtsK/SpoIIIE-like protein
MITNIVVLFGFGLVVFLVFWLTLAVTGSATAAFWSPVALVGVALMVRLACAGLDSSWYWRWKRRHDGDNGSDLPQPSQRKLSNDNSNDRLSGRQINRISADQLHQRADLSGRAENPGWTTCPEEFAHYTELALEVIRQEKRASTSLLQHRLNFSFKLASALIIELERRGILGPGEGAQPRAVLVDLNAAV